MRIGYNALYNYSRLRECFPFGPTNKHRKLPPADLRQSLQLCSDFTRHCCWRMVRLKMASIRTCCSRLIATVRKLVRRRMIITNKSLASMHRILRNERKGPRIASRVFVGPARAIKAGPRQGPALAYSPRHGPGCVGCALGGRIRRCARRPPGAPFSTQRHPPCCSRKVHPKNLKTRGEPKNRGGRTRGHRNPGINLVPAGP